MNEQIPGLQQPAEVREAAPSSAPAPGPLTRKQVMQRLLLLFASLLLLAAVGGALYLLRTRALAGEVARARTLLGTNQGKEVIASLAEKYPDNAEIQFLHCQQLALTGGDVTAQAKLARAAALGYPEDQIKRQGWIIAALTDFKKAQPALEALLSADPDDRDVALSLALGYSHYNRLPKAEKLAGEILERNPNDGPALCLRGRLLLMANNPPRAAEDLKKAVALGKDTYYYFGAHLLLGESMERLNDIPEAYAIYKECRAEQPENVKAIYRFGVCARSLGRLDEAMEAFQEILKLRPDDVEPQLQVESIYLLQKQYSQALDILKKVIAMYPEEPQALAEMAKIYKLMGDAEKASQFEKRHRDLIERMEKRRKTKAPPTAPDK